MQPLLKSKRVYCAYCGGAAVNRKGIRRNKLQEIPLYYCKACRRTFSTNLIKNVKYPPRIILRAVTLYNLGNAQSAICKILRARYKVAVPQTTLSSWLRQYEETCRFSRMREQALNLFPKSEMLFAHNLQHKQIYKFQLHKAKLELLKSELPEQKFPLLKSYMQKIPSESFPHHIFQHEHDTNTLTQDKPTHSGASTWFASSRPEQRASQLKFETLPFLKLSKQNYSNLMAGLALQLAKTNRERHEAVQNFMIANDSVTIAAEVPVYLTGDDIAYFRSKGFTLNFGNYRTPITGHIDVLQIRNGLIHVLDYKPDANKVNAVNQLTIYALALASRTKLAVKDFKCAWFDDKNYYEFFPLHAVYARRSDDNPYAAGS